MTFTNSPRNDGQCRRTIALSSSKPRPDANEELISRSVIRKSPLRVAALTSLLIACCTIDLAQTLTSFRNNLFTLLEANKLSIRVMRSLLAKKFSLVVSSSPKNTYSVSSVNVSLFTERILKHSLKTLVRLCSSSSYNFLACASHSLYCCFCFLRLESPPFLTGDDATKLYSLPPSSETSLWV